jgi:hypothetical protein
MVRFDAAYIDGLVKIAAINCDYAIVVYFGYFVGAFGWFPHFWLALLLL